MKAVLFILAALWTFSASAQQQRPDNIYFFCRGTNATKNHAPTRALQISGYLFEDKITRGSFYENTNIWQGPAEVYSVRDMIWYADENYKPKKKYQGYRRFRIQENVSSERVGYEILVPDQQSILSQFYLLNPLAQVRFRVVVRFAEKIDQNTGGQYYFNCSTGDISNHLN
jgi:hypothetical protein